MMHIKCLSNPLTQQVDVIISTVPWTDSAIPLMAPAALKPIVESTGLTCLAVDFNVEIYNVTLSQHGAIEGLEKKQVSVNSDLVNVKLDVLSFIIIYIYSIIYFLI
jgi:hypothetical protein